MAHKGVKNPIQLLLLGTLAALFGFLQGCAGTAKGKADSAYRYDASLSVVDISDSPADAWVTLRYPAMIETEAEGAFFDAYARHALGGRVDASKVGSIDAERVAKGMIAKSNYFAMSLYRELAEELPTGTVLLSPHIVYLREDGSLATRSMLATEVIPSVITIDFATYSFPDPKKMMDSPPLTFGDVVTPVAVVHSDHWMQPTTNGLLLASTPLINTAWQQSAALAQEEFKGRLLFQKIDDERSLDLVDYMNGGHNRALDVPTKAVRSSRRDVGAVENYPLEKILLDPEIIKRLKSSYQTDPFEVNFTNGIGTRIEEALKRIDHDRATFSDRQKLMAGFDPDLAFAFMSQSQDESVRARLQLAEKLIQAEREFLAAQSRKVYEGVYEGSYGQAMREMIHSEYYILEKRRSLARKQNMQTALAVLAMAGAAYAGSQANDSDGYNHSMATAADVLMIGSLGAIEASIATSMQSKQVGENFLMQMAPALNEQITVQVDLLEGDEEITARDYAEFREKTLALYQRSARSMTVEIETDCTYRHPSASSQGRWYGECANGLATGRGYGVIRDDADLSIEYIGDAEGGAAEGVGAMIVHSPGIIGATYFEGGFSGGLPDGTVQVELPGKAPMIRVYAAGQDRGKGQEANLSRMDFK
jgi:hypothetical protein